MPARSRKRGSSLPSLQPLFIEASECTKSVDLRLNVNNILKKCLEVASPLLPPPPVVNGHRRTFAEMAGLLTL